MLEVKNFSRCQGPSDRWRLMCTARSAQPIAMPLIIMKTNAYFRFLVFGEQSLYVGLGV